MYSSSSVSACAQVWFLCQRTLTRYRKVKKCTKAQRPCSQGLFERADESAADKRLNPLKGFSLPGHSQFVAVMGHDVDKNGVKGAPHGRPQWQAPRCLPCRHLFRHCCVLVE